MKHLLEAIGKDMSKGDYIYESADDHPHSFTVLHTGSSAARNKFVDHMKSAGHSLAHSSKDGNSKVHHLHFDTSKSRHESVHDVKSHGGGEAKSNHFYENSTHASKPASWVGHSDIGGSNSQTKIHSVTHKKGSTDEKKLIDHMHSKGHVYKSTRDDPGGKRRLTFASRHDTHVVKNDIREGSEGKSAHAGDSAHGGRDDK